MQNDRHDAHVFVLPPARNCSADLRWLDIMYVLQYCIAFIASRYTSFKD